MTLPSFDSIAGGARRALAARRADGPAGLAVALAMAAVWVHWLVPRGFMRGVSSYWRTDIADVTQYVSGFNAFFSEPWAWPLLRIRGLNAPEGTLATLVDLVPLYASLLKVVVPGDRFPFNPYGYWIAMAYLLMAAGAWWLLREARLPRYGALVALTGLLLVMPALNGRVLLGHVSLTSHWVILFALALYLRGGRSRRTVLAPWAVLLVGTFYINLYLFAMTGVVFAADVVRFVGVASWGATLRNALVPPGLILASLPLTMLPIPHVPGVPEPGFGYYALNRLAPFVDGGRLTSWMTRDRLWFVEGHYEGYNYLGAGALALLGVAIVLCLRHDRGFVARHRALLIGLALVTVYAASHRVYVGHRLMLESPVPPALGLLVGTFRASGRMFWLVGYALVGFAVVTCARWLSPRVATGVLALALLLQWLDLAPLRDIVHAGLRRAPQRIVDGALWDAALGPDVRTIYLDPKYGCGRAENAHHVILAVQRYAAERRLRLSTGYIARYHPPCDTGPREIAASDPARSVYVFVRGEAAAASPQAQFPPGARLQCRELDIAIACRWLATPG